MPAFEYLVRRRLLASLVTVGGSGIAFGGTGLGIRASGSGSGSRGSGSSSGLSFSGSLGSIEFSHFLGLLEHGHNSVVVVEHGTGTGGHLNLVDGEALVHINVGDVDGNLVGYIQRLGGNGNGFHIGFEEAAELDALGRAGEFDGHVNRDFLIEINTVVIDMGEALLVRMLLHVPEEAGICGLLAVVVNLKVENGGVADFKVELFERQGRNLHIDVFALAVVEDAGNKGLRTQTVSDAFAGAFSLLGTEGFFDSHNIYSLSAAGREDELYRRFACPRYAELDKKNADGRAGVNIGNGLSEERAYAHDMELGAAFLFLSQRNGVRNEDRIEGFSGIDAVNGRTGENGVSGAGDNFCGAIFEQDFRSRAQRACRVDHVVNDDGRFAFDIADDVHGLSLIGLVAALVHNGEGSAQTLRVGAGAFHAAGIGGNDDRIAFHGFAQGIEHDRRGEKVINGAVEEALNLSGVEVNGDKTLGAGDRDAVGNQLGADGCPRANLAILAGISVIRHNGGDAAGRSALQGIAHEAELDEVAVYIRRTRGLHNEDVVAADIGSNFDAKFAITESGGQCLG